MRGEAKYSLSLRNSRYQRREGIMKSPVPKHSITIAGHRTAVSLEGEFWNCLREIANRRGEAVAALVAKHRRIGGGTAAIYRQPFVSLSFAITSTEWERGGLPSSRWAFGGDRKIAVK